SNVLNERKLLNEEMVQVSIDDKKGPFYVQFSLLLLRLGSKVSDKRYGFLFQAPEAEHDYGAMAGLVRRLMDFSEQSSQIKVIDFSEVPADILPVIIGLVARIIYQVQFWTDRGDRKR